jgi:hypothetical protein
MGSKLELESQWGKGTEFSFKIHMSEAMQKPTDMTVNSEHCLSDDEESYHLHESINDQIKYNHTPNTIHSLNDS